MSGLKNILSQLPEPNILEFGVDKSVVIAGEAITLTWKTTQADKVYIDDKQVEAEGKIDYLIFTERTFRIRAESKSLLRRAAAEPVSVTVTMAMPVIERFDVGDMAEIREHVPVPFSFHLRNAAGWKLVANWMNGNTAETVLCQEENRSGREGWNVSTSVELKEDCEIILKAFNGDKLSLTAPCFFITRKPEITSFRPTKLVSVPHTPVTLEWEVKNANKITLHPGDIDVTHQNSYQYMLPAGKDMHITLKASGDFNRSVEQKALIKVAGFEGVEPYDNNDPEHPEIYLRWQSTYIEDVKIYPGGYPVSANEPRFSIPLSNKSVEYRLEGKTFSKDDVKHSFTLFAADIQNFELVSGSAIVGTNALLKWQVHHARRIILEPGIGNKTSMTETFFQVEQGMQEITLIAWGDINVAKYKKSIPLVKGPEIKAIKTSRLQLDITFSMKTFPARELLRHHHNTIWKTNTRFVPAMNYSRFFIRTIVFPSDWIIRKTRSFRQKLYRRHKQLPAISLVSPIVSKNRNSFYSLYHYISQPIKTALYGQKYNRSNRKV